MPIIRPLGFQMKKLEISVLLRYPEAWIYSDRKRRTSIDSPQNEFSPSGSGV
tara:strand:+ start:6628 stop:6783 length:156 start_codon:yes stop_codon:yes gene_type:complete